MPVAAVRPKKIGERIYTALRFGAIMPDEYWQWKLCMATGWSLEYVDALPLDKVHEWLQLLDAEVKARAK